MGVVAMTLKHATKQAMLKAPISHGAVAKGIEKLSAKRAPKSAAKKVLKVVSLKLKARLQSQLLRANVEQ